MFYRSGNKARKCMEPRHTGPEFHSELELDYTDNAIYLIWKWERVKLVDAGPRHFSQSECSLQTIQLCIDCTHLLPFQKRSWGKTDKPAYQGFLGNTGSRKICWKFRSSNEENSNLYQLVFSRWQNRYLSVNQSLEILRGNQVCQKETPGFQTNSWASQVVQMVKNLPAVQDTQVQSPGREDPWRRAWQPTPVLLPGESQGQRSPAGCSLWCRTESDMTERLTLSPSFLCSNVHAIIF